MSKILLSYRRTDAQSMAGRIHDRLAAHFGRESVFMDIDSIPFGLDFRDHLTGFLAETDALIAVMGKRWDGVEPGQPSRLLSSSDFVRLEIATALKRNIPVVPLLVEGAQMPEPESLPEDLASLAYRNAATVDSGRDFHMHMDRVIDSIERVLASRKPPAPSPSRGETDSAGAAERKLETTGTTAQAAATDSSSSTHESNSASPSAAFADGATAQVSAGPAKPKVETPEPALDLAAKIDHRLAIATAIATLIIMAVYWWDVSTSGMNVLMIATLIAVWLVSLGLGALAFRRNNVTTGQAAIVGLAFAIVTDVFMLAVDTALVGGLSQVLGANNRLLSDIFYIGGATMIVVGGAEAARYLADKSPTTRTKAFIYAAGGTLLIVLSYVVVFVLAGDPSV